MKLKADGKIIYEVYPNGGMFDICEADTEKNATLFAAAPEMLEALEKIEKTLQEKHQGAGNHTYELILISDAIKKAKGG